MTDKVEKTTEETKEVENEVKNQAQAPQNGVKFRFFCPACTGTAFTTQNKELFPEQPCQVCGKPVKYDENNFIEV